jgi:type IX secretion system PorP/SprF family membrane protein
MIRRLLILAIIFCAWGGIVLAQQNQLYTQFGFNKLNLNPAFAGNEFYHNITGIYRDQWNGFPGAPDAQVLSVDLARIKERVGVGFNFERQSIGINRHLTFTTNYAYKVKLATGTLSGGLSVGLRNLVRDFTDPRLVALQDLNQDQALDISRLSKNTLNIGIGAYYNNEKLFAGFSVPRVLNNDIELGDDSDDIVGREVRHLYLMTGGLLPINDKLDFKPQFLLRWAQNSPLSMDFNLGLMLEKKYHLAATYRSGGARGDAGESIDMMLGFQINDEIMMGFAYDFTLSAISEVEDGSVEVLFNYRIFPAKEKVIIANPRYF